VIHNDKPRVSFSIHSHHSSPTGWPRRLVAQTPRRRAVLNCVACAILIHNFVSVAGRATVHRYSWHAPYLPYILNVRLWLCSSSSSVHYQSIAGHRPLEFLAISLDLRLLASSSCQPSCANRNSTWPEGVLHYVYLDAVSTPELVYPSDYGFYGWYGQPTDFVHVRTFAAANAP
jgi:hypothetical protein